MLLLCKYENNPMLIVKKNLIGKVKSIIGVKFIKNNMQFVEHNWKKMRRSLIKKNKYNYFYLNLYNYIGN